MKKIKRYFLALIVFLGSFLFSKNIFAQAMPTVYGPPEYFSPKTDWSFLILLPILPLIALVALIIGVVMTLKRNDKTKPGSNKKSAIKIVIMAIGFIIFLFLWLIIRNFQTQTLYGVMIPPGL